MIYIDESGDAWFLIEVGAYQGQCLRLRDSIRVGRPEADWREATTRDLLEASIRKWQAVRNNLYTVRLGCTSCPLCVRFYDNLCLGCPVYAKTGSHTCLNTPYKTCKEGRDKNGKLNLAHVDAEIAFLESCLELTDKENGNG